MATRKRTARGATKATKATNATKATKAGRRAGVDAAAFRGAALALADAREVPHMDRAAFRTTRKIFATLAADEQTANLGFSAEQQELFTTSRPDVFAPVPGGWGRMGFTTMTLAAVDAATMRDALVAAHANALPKRPRRRDDTT